MFLFEHGSRLTQESTVSFLCLEPNQGHRLERIWYCRPKISKSLTGDTQLPLGEWNLQHRNLQEIWGEYTEYQQQKLQRVKMIATQSCPTLFDPIDYSPPGSSIHGILQARILEWVVMPFSRGSSQSRDQTQVSCLAGRFFPI